jgi:hypothetical protein
MLPRSAGGGTKTFSSCSRDRQGDYGAALRPRATGARPSRRAPPSRRPCGRS